MGSKTGIVGGFIGVLALGSAMLIAACSTSQAAQPTPTLAPTAGAAATATDVLDPATLIHFQTIKLSDTVTLEYASVLPKNFDPAQEYPILLALPPGEQDKATTQAAMVSYWAAEGYRRGWIILSPVAPGKELFFNG